MSTTRETLLLQRETAQRERKKKQFTCKPPARRSRGTCLAWKFRECASILVHSSLGRGKGGGGPAGGGLGVHGVSVAPPGRPRDFSTRSSVHWGTRDVQEYQQQRGSGNCSKKGLNKPSDSGGEVYRVKPGAAPLGSSGPQLFVQYWEKNNLVQIEVGLNLYTVWGRPVIAC